MSRRPPNPATDRASQNQQTLKSLVKLDGNKSCADCKRNKHPRWASWNLGVFVCIRCSGIHRGMGTHISRVKSVDLDAWTDEQMQSILRWGNTRANKYWEAKLAPGHVPSETKIENFIRTKYEAKRWVMDGGMPDPATLDGDGDEDVPLGVVQGKKIPNPSTSTPTSSSASQPTLRSNPAQNIDLFGEDGSSAAGSTATALPAQQKPQPAVSSEASKTSKPGESLLGLDFLGYPAPPATGSDKVGSTPAGIHSPPTSSRPDLKQSILSLYASASRQSTQLAQTSSIAQIQQQPQGNLHDAFSGLNFSASSTSHQQQPRSSPLASFGNHSTQKSTPAAPQLTSPASPETGFFDSGPKPDPKSQWSGQPTIAASGAGSSGTANAFEFGSSETAPTQVASHPKATADLTSIFDFSASSPPPPPPKQSAPFSESTQNSVFNLSAPTSLSQGKPPRTNDTQASTINMAAGWSNTNAWNSNDAWGSGDTTSAKPTVTPIRANPHPAATTANDFSWDTGLSGPNDGHGSFKTSMNPPKVSADEDFGGWSSAAPSVSNPADKPSTVSTKTGGGLSGSEDLFSNVWQ